MEFFPNLISNINKISWSCKRIEKAVIIFIILYTVKWNCCSLLKSILKIIISRLKATWSKQSFYDDATSFLPWDRNFQMNAGWKSPHLAEPAHTAGPAHLIQPLKFADCRLKMDSGTGVFLWILQNFLIKLICRKRTTECFCPFLIGIWKFSNSWYLQSRRPKSRKCTIFNNIFPSIHFKLILKFCTTSETNIELYQIPTMERFCTNS